MVSVCGSHRYQSGLHVAGFSRSAAGCGSTKRHLFRSLEPPPPCRLLDGQLYANQGLIAVENGTNYA
ncbi:hypothetical protein E2C01_075258 [Portunus trituberculatus]|uniref:Uncharacterized protein n=1 Tax=Portunus trituberculatus TaxID=210409 RepID=A0A5B7IAA0_PORTR|nr:hypothetical protein [Portunus trituberculatus]